mmetsp:Transcript_55918/g.167527  ORF Transcript_55918/g.167527 Transcript_55918/m.167527 type:complete len:187 (-) Transcript_55918:36-596(-)
MSFDSDLATLPGVCFFAASKIASQMASCQHWTIEKTRREKRKRAIKKNIVVKKITDQSEALFKCKCESYECTMPHDLAQPSRDGEGGEFGRRLERNKVEDENKEKSTEGKEDAVLADEGELCSNDVCPICLDPFLIGEKVAPSRTAPCVHVFHKSCIVSWLKRNDTCPCCRADYLKVVSEKGEERK